MQDGALASSGPVSGWTFTVLVDGVQRPIEGVSWSREVSSDMPEQVGGVSGIQAASGSIDWSEMWTVGDAPAVPWGRFRNWPPAAGSRITVWASDEATSWIQFTGRLDRLTGDASSGFSSRIIDDWDALDAPLTLDVVAERMPAAIRSGEVIQPAITTALEPWYVAHKALQAAGYGVTRPDHSGTALLDVAFQGSVYPDTGYLAGWAGSVALAWEQGYQRLDSGVTVTYDPQVTTRATDRAVRVWVARHATAGNVSVTLTYKTGATRRLRISGIGAAQTLDVWASKTGGAESHQGSLPVPAAAVDGAPWIDMLLGATAVHATATGNTNGEADASIVLPAVPTDPIRTIRVTGGAIAVLADYTTLTAWRALDTVSRTGTRINAWGTGLVTAMTATRRIDQRPASNVLTDIACATLTGMWLDETGTMQWAPSNVITQRPVTRTLTTRDDIFALGWEESLQSVRSRVMVTLDAAILSLTRDYGIQVWPKGGSSRSTLKPGEEKVDFLRPETGIEWIEPDLDFAWAGTGGESFAVGSWAGGTYLSSEGASRDDDEYSWIPADWLTVTTESLALGEWILRQQSYTASTDINLETPSRGTTLLQRFRNYGLPFVRARGEVAFSEITVQGARKGPAWAPILEHPLAHWATGAGGRAVANWLSVRVTAMTPILSGVDVDYDPRIQLGDKHHLLSPALLRLSVEAIVIGIDTTVTPSGVSMTLRYRAVSIQTTAPTYAEFEQAYTGTRYGALESAWSASTYSTFEADPLREA